jgi:homoserine dehydrogenase
LRGVNDTQPVRLGIIGLGAVGQWVLNALLRDAERFDLQLVAAGDRGGLVHRTEGLPIGELLDVKAAEASLATVDGVEHWVSALDALREIDIDILIEVSLSPPDGEPGLSHIRAALTRGIAVATSNKWPVAVAGTELVELARDNATRLRAESTVMSGTPVLSTLTEGIAGATPLRLRGVVNATVNFICSRVAEGSTYEGALREAQMIGLAEPDPSADVEGHDSVSKLMVLAGLVFGIQLTVDDVARRGLAQRRPQPGDRVREVMSLDPHDGCFRVDVREIPSDDPLARIENATNAIIAEVDPIGEITIAGPGAGPALAGQGVYSDVLRLATS